MGYKFGETSKQRLATCHGDLIVFAHTAIENTPVDFTIVCGERDKEAQEKAFNDGFSKALFGQSPHNYGPSFAVDIAPYVNGKIVWDIDDPDFKKLVFHLKQTAHNLFEDGAINNRIEWGGDWTSFVDYPHWQLRGWKEMQKD